METKKQEIKAVVNTTGVKTIAKMFQILASSKDWKDRDELAVEMVAKLKENGVEKTKKKNVVDKALILRQIRNMAKDINDERGKDAGSWWSTVKIQEDKDKFRLVTKKA